MYTHAFYSILKERALLRQHPFLVCLVKNNPPTTTPQKILNYQTGVSLIQLSLPPSLPTPPVTPPWNTQLSCDWSALANREDGKVLLNEASPTWEKKSL